jgi:hypothetical protein
MFALLENDVFLSSVCQTMAFYFIFSVSRSAVRISCHCLLGAS